MSKSELIRSTPGTPAEVVATLATQGVKVKINLVRQVQKNQKRAERAANITKHGRSSEEVRRLLSLGFTPAEIAKKYPAVSLNLACQVAHRVGKPARKRAYEPGKKKTPKPEVVVRAYEPQPLDWPQLPRLFAERYGLLDSASIIVELTPQGEQILGLLMERAEQLKASGRSPLQAYDEINRQVSGRLKVVKDVAVYRPISKLAKVSRPEVRKTSKPKKPTTTSHQLVGRSWEEIDAELDRLEE